MELIAIVQAEPLPLTTGGPFPVASFFGRANRIEVPHKRTTDRRPERRFSTVPVRVEVGVSLQHRQRHAVRPAEALLKGVFATTSGIYIRHIIFFDQSAGRSENAIDGDQPATRNLAGETSSTVALQSFHCDPMKRSPAVGSIPLLARFDFRRQEASR